MLVALIPALLGALLLFEVYRIISSHSGLDSNDQQFMAENINSALPLKFDFTKYSLNRQENYVQIQWRTTNSDGASEEPANTNEITYHVQVLTSNGTWIK